MSTGLLFFNDELSFDSEQVHVNWNQKGAQIHLEIVYYDDTYQTYVYGDSMWHSFEESAAIWTDEEFSDFDNDLITSTTATYS